MCSVAPNPPSASAHRSEHSPVHKVSWEGEGSREDMVERVRGEREEEWGARAFELERTQRRSGKSARKACTHTCGVLIKKTKYSRLFQSQQHLDSAGLLPIFGCRLITHQRIWPRVSKNGVVSILFCLSFYLSLTTALPEAGNAVTCVFFLFLRFNQPVALVSLFNFKICFVGASFRTIQLQSVVYL